MNRVRCTAVDVADLARAGQLESELMIKRRDALLGGSGGAVKGPLGGGAMAAVYRAHDEILDQPVALKILLPGADAVTRERFRREARVLATLIHSHIIPTYQVGQTNSEGYIYIAMELITGQSLAELPPVDCAH